MKLAASRKGIIWTQCEDSRNFLLLRFLREISRALLEVILAAKKFECLGVFDIFKREFSQKSKFRAFKVVKIADFDLLRSVELISRKI